MKSLKCLEIIVIIPQLETQSKFCRAKGENEKTSCQCLWYINTFFPFLLYCDQIDFLIFRDNYLVQEFSNCGTSHSEQVKKREDSNYVKQMKVVE